ncbi:PKD-like domain-containing protein [Flavobacterium capsici]|uniref:PKD domain-containing protein n=1 Tax=Flavobacterium capsici TaxID=3075618 RepID=A0AA96EXW0_9FLAO|nr:MULTISPECIES: PKD domain-containing protein [unclassified Flavobacterium]WNM19125.1 PKD domain-containing protein [Flavobacterium sp. PMR2A8]WNM20514.1 PKD domain-containing protein [Flavobacterium sp. PMTSA4]
MKQKYLLIILVLIYSFSHTYAKSINLPPSATISGTTTVCQNAASPVITFTGSGGTAPYTFTYTVTGTSGNQTVSTTGTNSSVTVSVPTGTAGTFVYNLVSVIDDSTPPIPQNVSGTAIVTINPQPNANMGGTGAGSIFDNFPVFRICSNSASLFNFTNTSTTSSTNNNYTINWGDGSPNFTGSSWTTLSHTYQIGLWYLNYTISGSNGCSITKTYIVFVGSNPAVSLGNPGNTDICNANSLTFPITGTSNNPPGTTYTVTFNDGSAPIPFNHPPPASVTHTFTSSSCGTDSSDGSNTYQNSFSANIVATNPCSTSSVGVVPIYVSANPQANFTAPVSACINTQVCLTNTSLGNQVISNTCSNPLIVWSISPSTGYSLTSGSSLGNDFSSTDPSLWLSGSDVLCLNFSISGTYTITMKTGNKCGIDTISKTICVQPPLTPLFSLNTNTGCIPLSVTTTNNTVLTNQCGTPTYLWTVTYASGFCSTASPTFPNQTTANANFNFTEPGTYTIRLATTNSCGTNTTTQTVIVKKPPTASIAAITGACGTANISPTATIIGCAPTTSTLTYAWSFPGGTPATANTANPGTINYPTTGNYTVSLVVTNECGASTTATQTFSVSTAPVITNTVLTESICSGSTTTPVTLTANPTGTTFAWTATATAGITGFTATGSTNTIPAQTITTTNSNPGTVTYVITPSFNGCDGPTVNYVITINPAPTITTQPSSSSVCLGGTPTALSVVINSSSGTPSYQWYSNTSNSNTGGTLISGQTNSTFNPPASTIGTLYYYCVITLTSGGCSSLNSNVATVTINPLPTINTQPMVTQNACVGVALASPLTVSYTGGIGTATYQWYSNTTNATTGGTLISGATNATYTPPVYTAAGTYYYYAIISLSSNGCGTTTSNSAEVVVFNDPTITTQPLTTQTLCQGATPSTLSVVASGGNGSFNYQWYSNTNNNTTNGVLIPSATNATYTPPTSSVGTIFYYCIITQNTPGCSVTSTTAAVIINQSPSIVNQPPSSSVCLGGTPTTLSFTYSNGAGTPTYQWYSNINNNNTSGTLITGETNATFTPPANTVGTTYYYCLVTFPNITGSCATIATNTAEIIITSASTIDQNPVPNQSLCVGATITTPLSVSYIGGTGTPNYQWYSNNTSTNTGGTPITGATNSTYTPPVYSVPGTYYYYVQISFSGSGCGSIVSDVATIDVIADPIITPQPQTTQTVCQNTPATTLSVGATGGIGTSYTYQWYSSTTNNTTTGVVISGETNSTFTPPTATTGTVFYYCVINQTNGTGCNAISNTAQVIVNPAPVITSQPQSNTWCKDQVPTSLTLNYSSGTGTPTYQWFSNTINSNTGGFSIPSATNATYTPPTNSVGSLYYYCIINFPSLSGGCATIISDTALITINQNPVIASESTTICSNNPFTITPSNTGGNIVPLGTTYTWSTPTINPAGAISGANSEATQQNQISQTLINTTTSPATVTYTVTPISGVCIGNDFTVTVVVNPAINPNVIASNNSCFGVNNASITTNIVGGIPPYTITWLGPNGFTSAATAINNLEPGIYDLTIDDTGNCPYTNTYTITEPDDILISIDSENDITCFGFANGSINISVTGGTGNYTYTWTKDTFPFSNNEDIANLSPGTYVVTVTDANNCGPKTETFTITQPPILAVSLISQTNVECFGAATGAININPSGGTPIEITPGVFDYNYAWTGPNGFTSTNQNLTNIVAGTYTVTITDNQGCTENLSAVITQSTEIIISYTTTPITCYGANNASFTTTISGGNPPYQYQWSNLSTALNQNNLSAGTYTITVTDNLGCIKAESIIIPEAPIFTVNPIVNNVSCYGANNGSINLNLTGGIPTVTLTWSDGSTAGLIRNNLGPGTYTATIADGTPCYIVRTFTILEPQPLVVSANTTNPLDCSNANTGAIDLIVAGGTPPFNYSWSNGASTEDLVNVNAGNYQVTVTDNNGCSLTSQFNLVRPAPIYINVTTQTDFNCSTHQVTQNFVAQASGGVPPFQYQWSSGNISGPDNNIMNSSTNGTVILTVTDNIGCTATYTVDVDNPVIGYSSFDTTSFGYTSYGIYSIGDPIQFQSNITGDYISVSWDFGDGTFSTELNPVHTYAIPKEYIVTQTVTYPFGCVYVQTISLLVEKGYLIVVPTAFTPNNDGLNDTYRPVTKRLKNVQLNIYDTWGSMIYSETGDVLVGWDGKIKGFNAENGNYYAKVTAETFYGTIIFDNQTFVLIK